MARPKKTIRRTFFCVIIICGVITLLYNVSVSSQSHRIRFWWENLTADTSVSGYHRFQSSLLLSTSSSEGNDVNVLLPTLSPTGNDVKVHVKIGPSTTQKATSKETNDSDVKMLLSMSSYVGNDGRVDAKGSSWTTMTASSRTTKDLVTVMSMITTTSRKTQDSGLVLPEVSRSTDTMPDLVTDKAVVYYQNSTLLAAVFSDDLHSPTSVTSSPKSSMMSSVATTTPVMAQSAPTHVKQSVLTTAQSVSTMTSQSVTVTSEKSSLTSENASKFVTSPAKFVTSQTSSVTSHNSSDPTYTSQTLPFSSSVTTYAIPTTPLGQTLKLPDLGPKLICHYFTGRLGNQLFQYASIQGLALAMNRTAVFIGDAALDMVLKNSTKHSSRQKELEDRCGSAELAAEQSCCKFTEKLTLLDPAKNYKVGYYLQSWVYWQKNELEVLAKLEFSDAIKTNASVVVRGFRKQYNGSTLIGVHVRRGDFTVDKNVKLGYPTASAEFLNRSVSFFSDLYQDPVFIVASDGIDWCRQHFPNGSQVHYLANHAAAVDLTILASLDHIVITFGSYSWWAGYLNKGTTVYMKDFILPDTFVGKQFSANGTDYVYPGWIAL